MSNSLKVKECKTYKEANEFSDELFEKHHQPVIMTVEYWNNSQLSVAKYSGGCTLNGVQYMIDYDTLDLVMTKFHPTYVRWFKPGRPHYDPKTGERKTDEVYEWQNNHPEVLTPGGDPLWECPNCGYEHVMGIETPMKYHRCPQCNIKIKYPGETLVEVKEIKNEG